MVEHALFIISIDYLIKLSANCLHFIMEAEFLQSNSEYFKIAFEYFILKSLVRFESVLMNWKEFKVGRLVAFSKFNKEIPKLFTLDFAAFWSQKYKCNRTQYV